VLRLLFVALTENETVRGVERYALELVRALASRHGASIEITLLCGEWQRYYRELESVGVRLLIPSITNNRRSRHLFLLMRMRALSAAFDLVHYGNLLPIAVANRAPSTMTIHDVAEFAIAQKYSRIQRWYRRLVGWSAARRVSRVVADSEFTRGEITRYLAIPPDRITVIYPGADHFRMVDGSRAGNASDRYFLYYGVIEETKGADTAILAFQRLLSDGAAGTSRLLLIGRPGNAYERLKTLIDGRHIVHLGYLEDKDLQRYIEDALAVIFVSRYEGFGLPAVESYMLNDTIIASSGNSVGEISRGFAFNVDETSVASVAEAMGAVLANAQPRPSLSRDEVRAKYSWAVAAREILALFLECALREAVSASKRG
jgi:glycosyltransferase involved in cell wall biosynthesis